MPNRQLLQFKLGTLFTLMATVAIVLAILGWAGVFAHDGVWKVQSIQEFGYKSWNVDQNGSPVGRAMWTYQALCVDGDRKLILVLASGLYNRVDIASLPVQKGDSFRILETGTTPPGSQTLADGTRIQKLTSSNTVESSIEPSVNTKSQRLNI